MQTTHPIQHLYNTILSDPSSNPANPLTFPDTRSPILQITKTQINPHQTTHRTQFTIPQTHKQTTRIEHEASHAAQQQRIRDQQIEIETYLDQAVERWLLREREREGDVNVWRDVLRVEEMVTGVARERGEAKRGGIYMHKRGLRDLPNRTSTV
ncbi:hypothetical protein Droror1_Dr00024212 [Drosera rotundifolia]